MSVIIESTLGDITVDLFLEERPRACLNFLKLCKMKYYNYSLFHTISRHFIAQTGDPTGSRTGGESIHGLLEGPHKRYYEGEKNPRIKHTRTGLVSFVGDNEGMIGSQFFITLGEELTYLDEKHCVFGEVMEGLDVLELLNETICDGENRPYKDIRITHTVVLADPYPDPRSLKAPSRSPSPTSERLKGGRIAADEDIDDTEGKSAIEISEMLAEREAKARATILEMVGDLPDAEMAPPENVLFVCKLNPVTTDDDLEIIFSRFGIIKSCEVIRDRKSGDSLQYAFVEFSEQKSCEDAYFKMDNVLIDDRRIHVDFSQSVSKIKWHGKGRGVTTYDDNGRKSRDFKNDIGQGKYKSNGRDFKNGSNDKQRYNDRRNRDEGDPSGRGRNDRHSEERGRNTYDRNDERRNTNRNNEESSRDTENRKDVNRDRKDDPRNRDDRVWNDDVRYRRGGDSGRDHDSNRVRHNDEKYSRNNRNEMGKVGSRDNNKRFIDGERSRYNERNSKKDYRNKKDDESDTSEDEARNDKKDRRNNYRKPQEIENRIKSDNRGSQVRGGKGRDEKEDRIGRRENRNDRRQEGSSSRREGDRISRRDEDRSTRRDEYGSRREGDRSSRREEENVSSNRHENRDRIDDGRSERREFQVGLEVKSSKGKSIRLRACITDDKITRSDEHERKRDTEFNKRQERYVHYERSSRDVQTYEHFRREDLSNHDKRGHNSRDSDVVIEIADKSNRQHNAPGKSQGYYQKHVDSSKRTRDSSNRKYESNSSDNNSSHDEKEKYSKRGGDNTSKYNSQVRKKKKRDSSSSSSDENSPEKQQLSKKGYSSSGVKSSSKKHGGSKKNSCTRKADSSDSSSEAEMPKKKRSRIDTSSSSSSSDDDARKTLKRSKTKETTSRNSKKLDSSTEEHKSRKRDKSASKVAHKHKIKNSSSDESPQRTHRDSSVPKKRSKKRKHKKKSKKHKQKYSDSSSDDSDSSSGTNKKKGGKKRHASSSSDS